MQVRADINFGGEMKFLILAGGSGTRLWPLSRKYFAKQFLNLTDDHSLLQNTATRVSRENGGDIYVITGSDSKFIVYDQLTEVLSGYGDKNLIVEPAARNTAPAIAYGMMYFDPADIVVVLSSDHHIKNSVEFNRILDEAGDIAASGRIVTLGIIPDSPKTGYGYIKRSSEENGSGYVVDRFVEKPSPEKAKEYLESGDYYWNAGIFVFKASVFLSELERHSSDIFNIYERLKSESERDKITEDAYMGFPSISVDYAVMEKSGLLTVIPADIGWSDIGSFGSLYDILPKDERNNSLKINKENFINIGSNNLFVYGGKRKISAIGLENIMIIDTEDSLLVCDKDQSEKVKDAVRLLQENNAPEADVHRTVFRPWGYYTILETGKTHRVNRLSINPGKKISFQFHKRRSETWTVIEGMAEIIKDNEKIILSPSQSVFIPQGMKHQISNPHTTDELTIIETQIGDYLDEDDIIRMEENH